MRMNYNIVKRYIAFLVGFVFLLSFLVPNFSFAQTSSVPRGKKSSFCEQLLTGAESAINQRIIGYQNKLSDWEGEKAVNLKNRWQSMISGLKEKRVQWDGNRQEYYAKIKEKVKNENQEQAFLEFQGVVETAVQTRRLAIDQALDELNSDIAKALYGWKTKVDLAIYKFKNSSDSSFEKAKSDCANTTVNPDFIRSELKANLESAHDQLKNDIQEINKESKEEIESAYEDYKQKKEKIISDFKMTIEKAVENLKTKWKTVNN